MVRGELKNFSGGEISSHFSKSPRSAEYYGEGVTDISLLHEQGLKASDIVIIISGFLIQIKRHCKRY